MDVHEHEISNITPRHTLFGFQIFLRWVYLMKVIPETLCAQLNLISTFILK